MAQEKKSSKADKKRSSKSAKAYVATFRRYFNKMKRVARHIKRTRDHNAAKWLAGANKILAMEYIRSSEEVRSLHTSVYG